MTNNSQDNKFSSQPKKQDDKSKIAPKDENSKSPANKESR